MDTHTQVPQRAFADLQDESSTAAPVDSDGDSRAAISERNILQWMTYLPEDCIRAMIQMGWDEST